MPVRFKGFNGIFHTVRSEQTRADRRHGTLPRHQGPYHQKKQNKSQFCQSKEGSKQERDRSGGKRLGGGFHLMSCLLASSLVKLFTKLRAI